ncbi:MAG: hypothetical protein FVQ83_14645 [Chloroflexi bacterium]|nr:hypothetical protein [Chloroflexota bacterium]
MVKSVVNGITTYFAGRHYQVEVDGGDTTTRKYYAAGGQIIAVRSFSWQSLAQLLAAALILLSLALTLFRRGLRRYESGSAIQVQV